MPASYFLVPSWDIHPEDVALGSVIASIKVPEKALSSCSLHTLIGPPTASTREEKAVSGVAKKSKQWSAGLFATFLQFVTLGGEVSQGRISATEVKYSCETVETKRFTPTPSFISKATEDAGVKEHFRMGGLGAKVFMITGIKTARMITITTTETDGRESNIKIGVDIPIVQATVGPKGSHSAERYSQYTRSIEGPIVFAFQVEKIKISLKGKVSHKGFIDGAMLSRGDGVEDEYVIERVGNSLDEDEADDHDVDLRSGIDDGTGEVCEIFVPGFSP